jgi:predicted TIM-barrel fold metal-dependent hydrolase
MIDTHAHVFHRGLKLVEGRRYAPDYDAPLDNYLGILDRNGISKAVIVQPSFLGTDNSYLLACLSAARGRLKGIAVVEPSTPRADLARLRDAGVAGIRLNLIGQERPDLEAPHWSALVADAAALGWQIELQCQPERFATLAPSLLRSGAPIVLDHFGLPQTRDGVDGADFAAILRLAASRRVWLKLSGLYRLGADGAAFAQAAYPRIRQCFGLDRLLWGSDWPHTQFEAQESYGKAVADFTTIVADADERRQIAATAQTLFGF